MDGWSKMLRKTCFSYSRLADQDHLMWRLMIESLTSASPAHRVAGGNKKQTWTVQFQSCPLKSSLCCAICTRLNVCASSFAEKQRELARKGSLKNNNTAGSPVNQQPKKNNVMARTRWESCSAVSAATGVTVVEPLALGSFINWHQLRRRGTRSSRCGLRCGIRQGIMWPGENGSCSLWMFLVRLHDTNVTPHARLLQQKLSCNSSFWSALFVFFYPSLSHAHLFLFAQVGSAQ